MEIVWTAVTHEMRLEWGEFEEPSSEDYGYMDLSNMGKAGRLVRFASGETILLGHANGGGGTCGCCQFKAKSPKILAYSDSLIPLCVTAGCDFD